MKKTLIAITALMIFIIAGAAIFVHLYLTDEKIKYLIIPPLEKTLGRKVEIGDISVSLFNGIEINDLAVTEADGRNVFARIDTFILKYRLLPLLRKKIEIDRIILRKPVLRISRDRNKKFNFSSLAVLKKKPVEKTRKTAAKDNEKMPLAVSVNRIAIENGMILINDKSGEIPNSEINYSLDLNLELNGSRPTFRGSGNARIKSAYGTIHPLLKIRSDFDRKKLKAVCDLSVEGQKIKLTATVKNYQTEPVIDFLLTSDRLNANKLIAMSEKLPTESTTQKTASETKTKVKRNDRAPNLPPITGKIKIARILYRDLLINDLTATVHSDSDKLFLDTLGLKTGGGLIRAKATVILNTPPAYEGSINIKAIEVAQIKKGLRRKGGGIADGNINLDATFTGRGAVWPRLADRLAAKGKYRLNRARITRNAYTELLAMALKNPNLAELTASDLKGDFTVKKGRLFLNGALAAKEIQLSSKGSIGLAKLDLDFPVKATLPPASANKISPEIRKVMADDHGNVKLSFRVSGQADKPRLKLDKKAFEKAAGKQVKKRAASEAEKLINKKLGNRPEAEMIRGAANSLLNGLFGGNK